ncbi:MAG TPA: thioredoxin family protein [Terriglobia bacterium]
MDLNLRRARLAVVATLAVAAAIFAAPTAENPIYDEAADAHQQVAAAVAEASKTGKNIVLDFGANWCGDCHALDAQMRQPELAGLIEKNYVVVHIDVGRMNKNLDLAQKYGIPLRKGIPALAVLDSHGKLLYSQDQGQFEDARHLGHDAFEQFFEQWKPKG